ncbi:MAG: hypothetical protein U0836_01690 [Pirellulales bacterium]
MTQEQPQQPSEASALLLRIGRFFVRQKPLGVGFQICRLDEAAVTVLEERLSLAIAEVRCRQLARLDSVSDPN